MQFPRYIVLKGLVVTSCCHRRNYECEAARQNTESPQAAVCSVPCYGMQLIKLQWRHLSQDMDPGGIDFLIAEPED